MRYSPIVQRLGGYPRLWFRDGGHLDLERFVPDAGVAEYMEQWRRHGVRVEWMMSRHGRLDRVLPQTLERLAHNAQTFAWRKHKSGS